jgi:branched-chain amino acid transport system permease protein
MIETAPGSAKSIAAPPKPERLPNALVAIAVFAALLALAPFVVYPYFLAQALCLALFACAFNLLVGYGGLLSFGHALFFGSASYFSAHAAKIYGWPPEGAVLAATFAAGLLGLVAGALSIRSQGIYFSMITLALAQLAYFIALQAPFTHGEDGIQGVPRAKLLGLLDLSSDLTLYYVVLAVFLFGLLAIYRIVHSPFGAVLKAIRENEPRAISLGYKVERYKLAAFVLSASLAGLAGATKAIIAQSATLTDMHWSTSGEVILMTLVGGMGTILGPVLGALVIVTMQNYLSGFGQWVTVIQGAIFVVCVLAFRRGVIGEIAARYKLYL